MRLRFPAAALCTAFALGACGDSTPAAEEAPTEDVALDEGTGAADMSPTLEGAGDMSSAAGAGATTGAMDGGAAGDDGEVPVGEGEGGVSDTLAGEDETGR